MASITPKHLAALRRKHGSMWTIEYVIEGYDEVFSVEVGGKCSQQFAEAYGKVSLAIQTGESRRHIHLKSIKRT